MEQQGEAQDGIRCTMAALCKERIDRAVDVHEDV